MEGGNGMDSAVYKQGSEWSSVLLLPLPSYMGLLTPRPAWHLRWLHAMPLVIGQF